MSADEYVEYIMLSVVWIIIDFNVNAWCTNQSTWIHQLYITRHSSKSATWLVWFRRLPLFHLSFNQFSRTLFKTLTTHAELGINFQLSLNETRQFWWLQLTNHWTVNMCGNYITAQNHTSQRIVHRATLSGDHRKRLYKKNMTHQTNCLSWKLVQWQVKMTTAVM